MTQPQSGSKKGVGRAVAFGALVVILVFGIINSSGSGSGGTGSTQSAAPTRLPQSRQPK
jgi:hypothetical protein